MKNLTLRIYFTLYGVEEADSLITEAASLAFIRISAKTTSSIIEYIICKCLEPAYTYVYHILITEVRKSFGNYT